MYDVNSQESFDNVRKIWLEDIQRYASPDVVVGLVANKADRDMLGRRWPSNGTMKPLIPNPNS